MLVENGNLKDTGDQVIITFDNPFTDVKTIEGITDVISPSQTEDNFVVKEFSYSYDNIEFSEYFEVDGVYLANIDINQPFHIKFRYTKEGSDNILLVLSEFTFDVTYKKPPKYQNQICASECVCVPLVTDCDDTFKPYELNAINCLQNNLNVAISQRYGWPSTYWRSIADEETEDVIFKEYSLYNKEKGRCVKIIIPDNKLPDNDTEFQMMDMDFYDMPFEIQIGRTEWQTVYGVNSFPKRKDTIYIDILDKIYSVDSSYLLNDMGSGRGTYYKVNLVKWQDDANTAMDEEVRAELTDLAVDMDDIFGEKYEEEIEEVTKPDQYKVFAKPDINNENYSVDKKVKYDAKDPIENNWTVISDSTYDLSDCEITNAVSYPNNEISLTESIAVVYWVKLLSNDFVSIKANNGTTGFSVSFVNKNIVVKNNGLTNTFSTNSILEQNKWYGMVLNISKKFKQLSLSIYKIKDNNKYANTENISSKLIKLYNNTKIITNEIGFEDAIPNLNGGKYKMTNIRIFDKMIPDNVHDSILNQNIVVDNNRALLIDNAIAPLALIQRSPIR